jgi:hypothetical protein
MLKLLGTHQLGQNLLEHFRIIDECLRFFERNVPLLDKPLDRLILFLLGNVLLHGRQRQLTGAAEAVAPGLGTHQAGAERRQGIPVIADSAAESIDHHIGDAAE